MNEKVVDSSEKVWVTNFCLTKGIIELEVKQSSRLQGSNFFQSDAYPNYPFEYDSKDTHFTLKSARVRANAIVKERIAQLEKQIGKLKKKTF